jgi:hypothetical protein
MPVTTSVTWWVGEQFNSDGSATYTEVSKSGGGHPEPGPNQIFYGPYSTQAKAHAAENRAGQLAAAHIYRGSKVGKGPGGLNIPGNQAPHVPNPLSSIEDFLRGLTARETWIRVVEVVLGGALIVVGVTVLAGNSKLGKTLRKTTPVGKIL